MENCAGSTERSAPGTGRHRGRARRAGHPPILPPIAPAWPSGKNALQGASRGATLSGSIPDWTFAFQRAMRCGQRFQTPMVVGTRSWG